MYRANLSDADHAWLTMVLDLFAEAHPAVKSSIDHLKQQFIMEYAVEDPKITPLKVTPKVQYVPETQPTSTEDGEKLEPGDKCPKCGGTIVLRTKSETPFLGCSNFKVGCRFSKSISKEEADKWLNAGQTGYPGWTHKGFQQRSTTDRPVDNIPTNHTNIDRDMPF